MAFSSFHNQTPIEFLTGALVEDKGTGVFFVPDPESESEAESLVGSRKVILVENLTYEECAKRGHFCLSFKWIPHKHIAFQAISAQVGGCPQLTCRYNTDCPIKCFCDPFKKYCVDR
jgi:hypothetical protein